MPTGVMNALGTVMITITMKKLEKMSKLVMVVCGMKIGRTGDALWIDINSRNNCWDNPWLYTWTIREKMIKEGEE